MKYLKAGVFKNGNLTENENLTEIVYKFEFLFEFFLISYYIRRRHSVHMPKFTFTKQNCNFLIFIEFNNYFYA